jgi:hypothetical protein
MSHDPRVGLCSINGDTEAIARVGVGRSCAAGNERGTRSEHTCFNAVSPAGAEFDDGPTGGGSSYASRFAGDERLEVKDGKEAGLDKLRFGDRCGDSKQRFAGKEDRAFREGPNIARETEPREIVEKAGVHMTKYG